jgi:hypothetical protein
MFSKVWSENMSNMSIKHFCHHSTSRAVVHSRSSESLFVISNAILLYGYIIMGRHISPEAGRANRAFIETFEGPL